jgi:integrase
MQTAARPRGWKPGMLRRKDGRWHWKFYLDGAPHYVYAKNPIELAVARTQKERELEVAPERVTLGGLLDNYVLYRDAEGYDKRGTADIKAKFRKYVRDGLGQYTLAELCLKPSLINRHFKEQARKYPGSRALQQTFDELRRCFRYGIKEDLCRKNPCTVESCDRPKYRSPEREPFTVEQVREMIDKAQGQSRVLIAFLAMTGARPGEVYALKTHDLDLLHRQVTFKTFMYRDENGAQQERSSGKSKRSARSCPLIPPLVQILEQHIASAHLGPHDYVFHNQCGEMLHENDWRQRVFQPLSISVGRPDARPYHLRHTCNTFLIELGVPAEVRAAILGHGKAVNLKDYGHVQQEAAGREMAKLAALFDGCQKGCQESAEWVSNRPETA